MADVTYDDPRMCHFVLIPLFSPGHMLPMAHFALALASSGHHVSLITTPSNAPRLLPVIRGANNSISVVPLPLPTDLTRESLDLLPSGDPGVNLVLGSRFLVKPLKDHLQSLKLRPTCLVSDFCFPWTRDVAIELNLPRYVFYSICSFTLLCHRILPRHYLCEGIPYGKPFAIPGLPQDIMVTREQAPGWCYDPEGTDKRRGLREAEDTADGIIVNTFSEMEPIYLEMYAKEMEKTVWAVGPLALHAESPTKGEEEGISAWLDSWEASSVVYVCFGSVTRTPVAQLAEIGLGLEATGRPFVWVIRFDEKLREAEEWLEEEGLEVRTKARGLIIRGWAPQVAILSHTSVGAFVTHCGWNSVMEAMAAGVPMVTWPRFGDQYLNERLVVDVVGTGVAVGAKVPGNWWSYEVAEVVGREDVKDAVDRVMGGGEEAERISRNAEELGVKARRAAGEGGSSQMSITGFIDEALKAAVKRAGAVDRYD